MSKVRSVPFSLVLLYEVVLLRVAGWVFLLLDLPEAILGKMAVHSDRTLVPEFIFGKREWGLHIT